MPRSFALPAACLSIALVAPAPRAQSGDKPPMPPAVVRLGDVRKERIRHRRFVTGEVRPARRSRVAGREPGLVRELPVRAGQPVEKDAVLARIDDTLLQLDTKKRKADRAVAQAILAEQQAALELATWRRDAQRELQKRGSSFERELREAESSLAALQARCTQAERSLAVLDAELAVLEQRLADTVVRAPFKGVVIARVTDQGEWLAAGGAVVELVAAAELEAWLQVPEALAPGLAAAGNALELHVEALDVRRIADTFRVVPQIDARTRTFPVVVTLPGIEGLTPGMSVSAWIPASQEAEHVTVPKDALLRNDIGYYVYVARGSGPVAQAMPATVERLFANGDRVVVRAPQLRGGERVVVEGNERLFPGAPITGTGADPQKGR